MAEYELGIQLRIFCEKDNLQGIIEKLGGSLKKVVAGTLFKLYTRQVDFYTVRVSFPFKSDSKIPTEVWNEFNCYITNSPYRFSWKPTEYAIFDHIQR